jgi:single-strand DNA-binding protein
MNNLNSILIEGNLVRDPLFRSTPKGVPLCTFSLASNRFFKQDSGMEKEVSFFDVEAWGKLAEHCYNLGHKGRGVRVVGRLKQDRWTGSDGKNHSRVTIVAEHVEFRTDFKKDGERYGGEAGLDAGIKTGVPAAGMTADGGRPGLFTGGAAGAFPSEAFPAGAFPAGEEETVLAGDMERVTF